MLIYDQPDFSGFVDQSLLISGKNTVFDSDLHEFFGTQATHWSVVLVGRFRHNADCDTVIYNRRDVPRELTELTFSVWSNLGVEIYLG